MPVATFSVGRMLSECLTSLLFYPARLSVSNPSVIPPGGQTTTTTMCTIWTPRVWLTGAKMLTLITLPGPDPHPSSKTKHRSWPQMVSTLSWVNIYWNKREGYPRTWLRLPKHPAIRRPRNIRQRISGQLSAFFLTCQRIQTMQFSDRIMIDETYYINPLRAKFFWGNINIYLHIFFMSFLHIDLTQVLKILPQVRPGPIYST